MKSIDLLEYQNLFLKNLENSGKSFNTLKNYKTDLNIFNTFLAGKGKPLHLTEVTTTQMKEYSKYLNDKYNSPNSIRRRVQALRIFFDYLIAENYYEENPVKNILVSPKVVDLPKPCEFHHIKKIFENLESIQKSQTEHDKLLVLRNKVLMYLIYGGCLKVSDIERLKTMHITQAKDITRVLVAPEKKEPFTVPMPKSFTKLHADYLSLLEERKNNDQVDFDDYLFNANPFKILKGGISARGIEVIFKEISKAKKITITAKNLRQAGIFKLLAQDTPVARIKEWMGVQPAYSLKPYQNLLESKPEKYCFTELNYE